jgi:DNA-binding protein HU-beta
MNKQELIAAVSEASALTKIDSGRAVEAVFDVITSVLHKGDEVRLVGFGTFAVTTRKAAKGRKARTGEEIDIASSKTPKFRAGKVLKDTINA